MSAYTTRLGLDTIAKGQLERDFQKKYKELLAKMEPLDKASVSIKIELVRSSGAAVGIQYTLSASEPKRKVGSMGIVQMDGQQSLLMIEAPDVKIYQGVTSIKIAADNSDEDNQKEITGGN